MLSDVGTINDKKSILTGRNISGKTRSKTEEKKGEDTAREKSREQK